MASLSNLPHATSVRERILVREEEKK